MRRYIIGGGPYAGRTMSILLDDGTVAWSGGQTLAEYEAERGPVRVVTEDRLNQLEAEYQAKLITHPEPVTADDWDEALNALYPARWETVRGVEMFAFAERLRGSLTCWFARIGDRYWSFVDEGDRAADAIAEKVQAAAATE